MTLRCAVELDPCAHRHTDDHLLAEEGKRCPAVPPQT